MASYVEFKRSLTFQIGFVCSKCRALITDEGMLIAMGRSGSEKKAKKSLEKAYTDGVEMVKNGSKNPYRTRTCYEFRNETGFNSLGAYFVEGIRNQCPYCGHRELWQAKSTLGVPESSGVIDMWTAQKMKEIPVENRPHYFPSRQHAELWRLTTVKKLLGDYESYWGTYSEAAAQIRHKVSTLDSQINSLKQERQGIDAAAAALRQKIEAKNQETKSFPMFSKERKAVTSEVKYLQKMLSDQQKADHQKTLELNEAISALEKERKDLLIAYPGVTGNMQTYRAQEPLYYSVDRLE